MTTLRWVCALVFVWGSALNAQQGDVRTPQPKGTLADTARLEWVRHIAAGGASGVDVATDVAIGTDGSLYVAAKSESRNNGRDYLTIKYNATGQESWRASYDGPTHADDVPSALAVDGAGNVYVTGMSMGTEGDATTYDYATIKYNIAGQQEWVVRYSYAQRGTDAAVALAVDSNGSVYVTGESDHSDSVISLGYRNSDFATIKYGSGGTQLWVARYDGSTNFGDEARALALDDSGNVFVTGMSNGYANNEFHSEIVTLKYDPSGAQQWVTGIELDSMNVDAAGIAADNSGGVYITGQSNRWGWSSHGGSILTARYSADGNRQWLRFSTDSLVPSRAHSLVVDHSGNIIVSGVRGEDSRYRDQGDAIVTLKYNPTGDLLWEQKYTEYNYGTFRVAGHGVDNAGNIYVAASTGWGTNLPDIFGKTILLFKYDAGGNDVWVQRYEGEAGVNNLATAMAVSSAGLVAVAGRSGPKSASDVVTIKYQPTGIREWDTRTTGEGTSFESVSDMKLDAAGNVYVTGSSINGATLSDYITAKFDASGNQLWSARYNSPDSGYDSPTAIVVDESGCVYVTGSCRRGYDYYVYGNLTYATVKYSPTGNIVWTARYQVVPHWNADLPYRMDVDRSGNVYVAGSTRLLKYDNQGNQLWTSGDRVYAMILDRHNSLYFSSDSSIIKIDSLGVRQTFAQATGSDIAVDDSGNVYVTRNGWYPYPGEQTTKLNPSGSVIWSLNRGGQEILLGQNGSVFIKRHLDWSDSAAYKISPAGLLAWAATVHGPWLGPMDFAVDGSDNLYLCGINGPINGDDAVAIKYGSPGVQEWSASQKWSAAYSGLGSSRETPYAIRVDALDNVYVAITTENENFTNAVTLLKYSQVTVSVKEESPEVPLSFSLSQNYPNPFNPSTTIRFALPKSGHVELKVYNTLGQEVATLVNEEKNAGTYSAQWNAGSVASGVYFYRLKTGEYSETRRLLLVK